MESRAVEVREVLRVRARAHLDLVGAGQRRGQLRAHRRGDRRRDLRLHELGANFIGHRAALRGRQRARLLGGDQRGQLRAQRRVRRVAHEVEVELDRQAGTRRGEVIAGARARAQTDPRLDAVVQRLEMLERQNAELREQVGLLRQELGRFQEAALPENPSTAARIDTLEEKVELNAGRLSEQDQVKVEGA